MKGCVYLVANIALYYKAFKRAQLIVSCNSHFHGFAFVIH